MARATPRLIDRADLLAALDRASARRVTIISAPAGSGKTSLLRAWADRPDRAHRLAVVQVRRDQHDAQEFWLALLDAVRHASGATSGAEPPAATPDFNASAMIDRVLSELADARGDIMLVIDDLHELDSPDALAPLTRLLTNLPPGAHAVLTTRHDLRLGLHQLRLVGELAEIRAADLRFTERETTELLDASGVAACGSARPAVAEASRTTSSKASQNCWASCWSRCTCSTASRRGCPGRSAQARSSDVFPLPAGAEMTVTFRAAA